MKRTFHIRPTVDGTWHALESGNSAPLVVTRTRKDAQDAVFSLAREVGNSRVLVYNEQGHLLEERTFDVPRK
jgi:hypothetical protein